MSISSSDYDLIENEVIFRQHNERVEQSFEEIKELAEEDGQEPFMAKDDIALHFYCECSDENCRKRIIIKPSEYEAIHKKRNRFVIISGHQAQNIERIVKKEANYDIVEKNILPPETATKLNKTDIDNS